MHVTVFMLLINAVLMERPHGYFTGYGAPNRTQLVLMQVTLVMGSIWHNSH